MPQEAKAMNKIVRRHFPAEKLPEELKAGLDPCSQVTVTLEAEDRPEKVMSLEEMFALRRDVYASQREINADIDAVRDEWGAP
jgi:CBS-domain-containing membrane protein